MFPFIWNSQWLLYQMDHERKNNPSRKNTLTNIAQLSKQTNKKWANKCTPILFDFVLHKLNSKTNLPDDFIFRCVLWLVFTFFFYFCLFICQCKLVCFFLYEWKIQQEYFFPLQIAFICFVDCWKEERKKNHYRIEN